MGKTFPERVKGSFKNRVFSSIPDGKIKDWVWWQYMKGKLGALQQEILTLDVEESGESEGFFFVKLRGGLTFYDWGTPQSFRSFWSHSDKQRDFLTFGVLDDIITRYKYPQAIPIAPPFPSSFGHTCYHHSGSIGDMKISPEQKFLLTERFTPKFGDIFLDVGAYIGFGTMRLSELVGSQGKVIAFECNPDIQKLLVKNVLENKLSNVTVIDKAIWNKNEEVMLGEAEPQGRSLIEGNKTLKVEGITIDSIVEELKLPKVDFISLTINGAEIEALQGAKRTLERYHPSLSAIGWVHRSGQPVWKTTKPFLESIGYTCLVGGHGRVVAWKD